jgi:hypothetical protein
LRLTRSMFSFAFTHLPIQLVDTWFFSLLALFTKRKCFCLTCFSLDDKSM